MKKNGNLFLISVQKYFFPKKLKSAKKPRIIIILILSIMAFIVEKKFFSDFKYIYIFSNNYKIIETEKLINSSVENMLTNYSYNKAIKNSFIPYLKYIEYAKKGVLLNKIKYNKSSIPKVSFVISLYNREQYINSTLLSIQNQDLSDIEIIVVDDSSTDNSSTYVRKFQVEDPRIILLENKENMGTLYSKSIGVLYARGEYIQSLDSDDMICNKKYLSIAYNEAIKGKYDLIESKALYIRETRKSMYYRNPFWVVLWSKLIKKEIYLNTIYNVGFNVLKMKVKVLDDDMIALTLFLGKRRKRLNLVGIAHFIHLSQHIYFNAFANKKNALIYCRNFFNTVKAFYAYKNPRSFRYGQFLFKNYFLRGPCKSKVNWKEIVELKKSIHKI